MTQTATEHQNDLRAQMVAKVLVATWNEIRTYHQVSSPEEYIDRLIDASIKNRNEASRVDKYLAMNDVSANFIGVRLGLKWGWER